MTDEPGPEDRPEDRDVTVAHAITTVRLADFIEGEPTIPYALLLVVAGEARGQVLVVGELPAVVGRSEDADLTLVDDTVSRRHARLDGDRSAVFLADLGSSNGTTLNGNPSAGDLLLRDGDIVGFGSASVLVKLIA